MHELLQGGTLEYVCWFHLLFNGFQHIAIHNLNVCSSIHKALFSKSLYINITDEKATEGTVETRENSTYISITLLPNLPSKIFRNI